MPFSNGVDDNSDADPNIMKTYIFSLVPVEQSVRYGQHSGVHGHV